MSNTMSILSSKKTLSVSSKSVKYIIRRKWRSLYRFLRTREGKEQVKQTDPFGLTILSICVAHDPPIEILKQIIDIQPAIVNSSDVMGLSPLHMACKCGASSEIVTMLVQCHAKADAIDNSGRTPLHYAVEFLCEPLEINTCSTGSPSTGDPSAASSRTFLFAYRQSKEKKQSNAEGENMMSMALDEFQDKLQGLKVLLFCNPNCVLWPDNLENTPIDIVQDCKADYHGCPKWERADIVCTALREKSVSLYRRNKAIWENQNISGSDGVASTCGSNSDYESLDFTVSKLSLSDRTSSDMDVSSIRKESEQPMGVSGLSRIDGNPNHHIPSLSSSFAQASSTCQTNRAIQERRRSQEL